MRATGASDGPGGMPRRVLVTGANGLIGTALCHRLHGRGHRVRALCGPAAAAAGPPAGVEVAHGDMLDAGLLTALVAEMDTVVHLAGPPSVSESFQAPVAFARAHVEGTVTLLEACRATRVRRIVYVSSAEIYVRRARTELRYRPEVHLKDGLKQLLRMERRGAMAHESTSVRDGSPGLHRQVLRSSCA